jgi:hypothetical protein
VRCILAEGRRLGARPVIDGGEVDFRLWDVAEGVMHPIDALIDEANRFGADRPLIALLRYEARLGREVFR